MPWNSALEQEYDAMFNGPMGQALDLPSYILPYSAKRVIKSNVYQLEMGNWELNVHIRG